jgi:signal transduction histidine kinase
LEPSAATPARRSGWIRPQDLIWVVLFAALAIFGPYRSPGTILVLTGMGIFQIVEPNIPYFFSPQGAAVSFAVKLVLCYALIDQTNGIASSYYWLLLIPVMSAATTFGLLGTMISICVGSGLYLWFMVFLTPDQYIDAEGWKELALHLIALPIVGFWTHQLAEAKRVEARRYQIAAEQLAEANENLQKAEAAATRSERLAALGQLSAGLAHELRNPLGTMKASAEMLLQNVPSDNAIACEMAQFISSEVDRTDSLITRFLDFARPLALRSERADVGQVIDLAVEEIDRHRPPFDVAIYKNYSPDIRPFRFDPELMQRVFYNLILNAIQASPPRSSVTVKTRALNGTVEIAVIDRGSGIAKNQIENIFNPFFTTKSQGVGLGLAIVSKIVDQHGGKIAVESEPGSGSVFRVYLPTREDTE